MGSVRELSRCCIPACLSCLVVVAGSLLMAAGGHSVRAARNSGDLQGRFHTLLPCGGVCSVCERRRGAGRDLPAFCLTI